jgi:hypothetical protein
MGLRHNPITYLFLSNALLWGLPLSINHWQGSLPNREAESGKVATAKPPGPTEPLFGDPFITTAPPLLSTDPRVGSASINGISGTTSEISTTALLGMELRTGQSSTAGIGADHVPFWIESTVARRPSSDLLSQLRGADGLGGAITLANLDEPAVPIAARAEQLQWQRSNDALAALPLHWRDPLRKELGDRVQVSEAATVRLPVRDLAERQELPVIITDQGVAEGLVKPRNPRTLEAMEKWAARQRPAQAGTVQVMVVAAEPVEAPAADSGAVVATLRVSEQKSEAPAPPPLPPLPEQQL